MVAKKDTHAPKHPELEAIPNLQVIKALTSLKSRGYVKEQFAWRHYYWYLTNEGIGYLRTTSTFPQKLCPPPSRDSPDPRPGQDPVLAPAVDSVTSLPKVTALPTVVLLVLMAIRLAQLAQDLHPWNSEEDLAVARPNKRFL